MSVDLALTYSGWFFTVIGTGVALFTLYRERKFKAQMQIENWAELKTAIQINAQCQVGLRAYIERHKDGADPFVVQRLSWSDAFAQELILGILKRIHYSEPSLNFKDIQRWRSEGKLGQPQADMLVRIALDPQLPKDVQIDFEKR